MKRFKKQLVFSLPPEIYLCTVGKFSILIFFHHCYLLQHHVFLVIIIVIIIAFFNILLIFISNKLHMVQVCTILPLAIVHRKVLI